jgi:hypothetical protein
VVTTANGVNVDFADAEGAIGTQHYAFLVSEPEFDAVFGRGDGRRRWQGMRMAIGECFFRVGVRHHQRPSMRATKPEMSL